MDTPHSPKRLPRYRCHKVVEALKVSAVGDRVLMFYGDWPPLRVTQEYMDKHKPQADGYWVQYSDGYQSWSPADVFEAGYEVFP